MMGFSFLPTGDEPAVSVDTPMSYASGSIAHLNAAHRIGSLGTLDVKEYRAAQVPTEG